MLAVLKRLDNGFQWINPLMEMSWFLLCVLMFLYTAQLIVTCIGQFTLWSFWIMDTSKHFTGLISYVVLDCFTDWLSPFTTISCESCCNLGGARRFFRSMTRPTAPKWFVAIKASSRGFTEKFIHFIYDFKTGICGEKNWNIICVGRNLVVLIGSEKREPVGAQTVSQGVEQGLNCNSPESGHP